MMIEYSRALYDRGFGQRISTDVEGVGAYRAFLARVNIPKPKLGSVTAALEAAPLGATAQTIAEGITNPDVARNIQIVGSASGITTDVKITGTDLADKEITETIAANGTSEKAGSLAFKTVTKIELPIQTHTPAQQTETIEVTNRCTTSGDIGVAVTATTLLGTDSGKSVTVTLDSAEHTTVALVAEAVVEALNENDVIGAVFTASNVEGVITLKANEPLANDASLAIAFTVGSTGVTAGGSTNGTSGVPYDKISVGYGDVFGLPYVLSDTALALLTLFNGAKNASATITKDKALSKNTVALSAASPDGGKDIDVFIIV